LPRPIRNRPQETVVYKIQGASGCMLACSESSRARTRATRPRGRVTQGAVFKYMIQGAVFTIYDSGCRVRGARVVIS